MPRPKGKARAAARSGQDEPPANKEELPEILKDPNHSERLAELGSFALKLALANNLAAAYPDADAALLSQLRDVNLSRHNLTLVADRLESKGLILLTKAKADGISYITEWGVKQSTDAYGMGVAGDISAAPAGPDSHQIWEAVRLPGELGGAVLGGRVDKRFKFLEATMKKFEPRFEPIKRVPIKDLGKGFRSGMPNYTMQSAGLNYIESGYDVLKFWEKYKKHMEPIIGPEDLENSRRAAGAFEAEMKGVIEVVPRYLIYSLHK